VDLPKLLAEELAPHVTILKVADIAARYADVDNPKAATADNRILGVILPLRDQTWFFKMTGPHDLVGQHKAAFESFVKSVKTLGDKE
jgi:hypothetical protein